MTDMTTLQHARQQQPWGCLWHAAYAITGESWCLEHVNHTDPFWQEARLLKAGWMTLTLHEGMYEDRWTTRAFWEGLRNKMLIPTVLLSIAVLLPSGLLHEVAVEFPRDPDGQVVVSDSLRVGPVRYSFEDFCDWSAYYAALRVRQFVTADLELFDPHDVRDGRPQEFYADWKAREF